MCGYKINISGGYVINKFLFDMNGKFSSNFYAIITTLLSLIVVYGFELTHFTVSIDEDTLDTFTHTIDLGRWGHTFIKYYIFPDPWAPYFSMLFSLLMVAITSSICCACLNLAKKESIFFSILFVSLPQLAYQLQYTNQDESTGLALLASAGAGYLSIKGGYRNLAICVILYIATMSLYQSYIFFGACLVTLKLFKDYLDNSITIKKWFIESVKVCACLIVAVLCYILLSKAIKTHFNLGESSYLSSLVMWGPLGIVGGIKNSISFIYQRFSFQSNYGLNTFPVCILFALVIIVKAISKKDINGVVLSLLLLILVLISPFFMNILIANGTPARTLSQMPLIFAGVIIISFKYISSDTLKAVVTGILLLIACAASSQLFYSDYYSESQNTNLSQRVLQDIYRKYPKFNSLDNRVLFYGKMELKNPWRMWDSNDFGVSFFERGDGNRIANYINVFGIGDVRTVEFPQSIPTLNDELSTMNEWPKEGSIKMVGKDVIVKLSD
jgi:hypothetical protein